MKLVLGTNIWSHHQVPISRELAGILGADRFRMALFEDVPEERRRLGWEEHGESPWVIGPPRDDREKARLLAACRDADVMIFGACPAEVLKARVAADRLTFVAAERLLKCPFHRLRLLNPRYARGLRGFRLLVDNPRVHALSIGHYASTDLRTIGAFADRIWKWGYFVDVCPDPPEPLPDRPLKVLWAGRMLDWKKVDVLLRAVARIQDAPWFGECLVVGDGPERSRLEGLCRRLRLPPGRVRFQPTVPFEEVRRLMRDADVYVLASDRQEGWGAVAGEAMSEGCLVVANEQAGAARDLVLHGATGFLYDNGDVEQLASLLERLAADYRLRMRLRREAWQRMNAHWSPRVAAERLVTLAQGLLGRGAMPKYSDGPCSRA